MRVDYLGLEAFVRIAEHGSFQRAAEVLHLSQTALSHRLRKVETDLGAALMIRSSREVSLTRAGQDLLPQARRLLKELHDTYAEVRARGRESRRRLAFACLPTIANALLPPVLKDFAESRPDLVLRLHDIAVHRIAELVQSGGAEFGITIVSAHLSDLRVRALFDEPYMLLVPADHPLAQRGSVRRADLDGMPMAKIATQFKNRQLVDDTLGEFRDRIQWRYEVQNATAAMSLVAAGAAFTILPRSAIALAPYNLALLSFEDARPSRSVGIVTRRGVPLSEPATDLLARIEAHVAASQFGEARTEEVVAEQG